MRSDIESSGALSLCKRTAYRPDIAIGGRAIDRFVGRTRYGSQTRLGTLAGARHFGKQLNVMVCFGSHLATDVEQYLQKFRPTVHIVL
ncbi:MAG: hypothetical protein IPG58_17250 [Acidobacteria bacterium]|nr:hypothetical protein [Acidobacteriota bacterium]